MEKIKKSLADREKEIEVRIKKFNLEEQKKKVEWENARLENDRQKTLIEKISQLKSCAESQIIDSENHIPGGDYKFKPTFNPSQLAKIKNKMMNLIDKL